MRYITTPTVLIISAFFFLGCGLATLLLLLLPPETPGETAKLTGSILSTTPTAPTYNWLILTIAAGAVASFLFTSGVKLHAEARDRAFKVIAVFRKDPELEAAFQNVGAFFKLNKVLDEKDVIQLYNSRSKNAIKLRGDISLVGNFFEEVAIAILNREINEAMVQASFSDTLVRYYEYMRDKHILKVLRNNPPIDNSPFRKVRRPQIYCNLDELYKRWWLPYKEFYDYHRRPFIG